MAFFRGLPLFIITLFIFSPAAPLASEALPLRIEVLPGASLPLGADASYFGYGGALDLRAEAGIPAVPALSLGGDLGYTWTPLVRNGSFSIVSAGLGLGLALKPLTWLGLEASGRGGYFYAVQNSGGGAGGQPFVEGGAAISASLSPAWSLSLAASYRTFFGFLTDIKASVGCRLSLGQVPANRPAEVGPPAKATVVAAKAPASPAATKKGLELESVSFKDIFPVFYKFYDDNPIGRATIRNLGSEAVSDLRIGVFVKEYMTNPKSAKGPDSLGPGESAQVDLLGLFTKDVLSISETTKVSVNISLEYSEGGRPQKKELVETLRILDRNALTWDDDRKAAAFVSAKDPTVAKFSRNASAMVKDGGLRLVDANLLCAMAMHSALCLYGLNYVSAPIAALQSRDSLILDSLQFPQQTMEYRSGNCSDLTILYASVLESLGVETAFITVPGHIYLAFALKLGPDEARRQLLHPDELIMEAGRAWVPFEITMRDGDFLRAWSEGVREWRDNSSRGAAALIPVHEAWKRYEPVGFSGSGAALALAMPAEAELRSRFKAQSEAFVKREISEREAALLAALRSSQGSSASHNALGVLYARYGLLDKATSEFGAAVKVEDYVPALVNLGNVLLISKRFEEAIEYYARAQKRDPTSASALIGLARANHSIENYASAKKAYEAAKLANPALAAQFSYLELRGAEATRAAEKGEVEGLVFWEEGK